MRAERLLAILLHLRPDRRVTTRDLARRLEVSERTLHRDMQALSAAGVPVTAERGPGGGWFLLHEYRTRLTGLTPGELSAAFLPMPERVLRDLGLRPAAHAALAKLLAELPEASRREAERARAKLHVDAALWREGGEGAAHLTTLQEAVWSERKLRFTYAREGSEQTAPRVADPLGLVVKGGAWYLVAGVDGLVRTYRASRVRRAEILPEPCVRPQGFDLARFWEEHKAKFVRELPRFPFSLRLRAELLGRAKFGGRFTHFAGVVRERPDGALEAAFWSDTPEVACAFALSLGSGCEVLGPPELREWVRAELRAALNQYEAEGADTRVQTAAG